MAAKPFDFVALVQKEVVRLTAVAEARVRAHGNEFAADWRTRFGNADLIGDESGEPGSAPPLSRVTLDARSRRREYGEGMLYDPSLDHVAEVGTIKDSIEQWPVEVHYGAKGDGSAVDGGAFTRHPKFPLNEYGLGVPTRTTLLPSNLEVGAEFGARLKRDVQTATGRTWAFKRTVRRRLLPGAK